MYLTLLLSIYIPLILSSYIFIAFTPLDLATRTLRFKINGGGDVYFFVNFGDSSKLILTPPPLLISRISRGTTQKFINIS